MNNIHNTKNMTASSLILKFGLVMLCKFVEESMLLPGEYIYFINTVSKLPRYVTPENMKFMPKQCPHFRVTNLQSITVSNFEIDEDAVMFLYFGCCS